MAQDGRPGGERPPMPGRRLVAPIAAVLLAGLAVLVAYKTSQPASATMAFQRLDAGDPAAANATVLDAKAVHDALYLEDHLATARQVGASSEDIALRVESMRETLAGLTGHAGPWTVSWNGVAFRITTA